MVADIAINAMRMQAKTCDHRNSAPLRIPQNIKMDVEWIRRGLEKPGKTQRGLAEKLGLDPAAVNRLLKGGRQLKADEVALISEYLESPAPISRLREINRAPSPEPDRIPVLGTAEGGEEGWSLWNGDVVDHVARPPSLTGSPNGYACYVTGTSMEPRYHPGELIFVHPGKPVMIGSYVLVQARPRAEGEPPRAVVKRLAKRSPTKLVLEQFNPAKTFDVQLKDVISVHRIMGSGE